MPSRLIDKARDHGDAVVASYTSGRSDASRAVGVPEHRIDGNAVFQTLGRICEVAGCLALGLDADDVLHWMDSADPGWDFQFGQHFIDVKGTWHRNGRRLIWPSSKTHFYHETPSTVLMLVKTVPFGDMFFGTATALGWISKARFFAEKIVAQPGDETHLTIGSWFVDQDNLDPMGSLVI